MTKRTLLALLVLAPGPALFGADAPVWQAGVSRVKITPEKPMWMSGYASRTQPAQGTRHDLWAKAVALKSGDSTPMVLVTMDLVGIPRDLSLKVCAELERLHGLPRESIMLSTSHTHCGPVVGHNLGTMYFLDAAHQKLVKEYSEKLERDLVIIAGEALARLAPAKVAYGQGQSTFAVNRRENVEADVPTLRAKGNLKGPVDHDVPVLTVRAADGSLKAVVFGYACHATTLSFYEWCGDYPGYAQIELEKAFPGSTAMFWAGCGGDQNPLPRRTPALAEEYGRRLAQAVEGVANAPMKPLPAPTIVSYREVPLAFAELPTRDKLLQDSLSKDKYVAARAKSLLQELERSGSIRGTYPYPIQIWQFGDGLTWIALGGEVVVDYSLRLKSTLGPTNVWVSAYCNDVMAYIPSLRVLKEGRYEGGGAMVYYGLPTVWSPRVEDTIIGSIFEVLRPVPGQGRK